MSAIRKLRAVPVLLSVFLSVFPCHAQDLAPRAYIIAPIHTNAVVLTYSLFDGGVLFDPTIPITNANAQIHVSAISLYHTLNFFGRSANLTATYFFSRNAFSLGTNVKTEAPIAAFEAHLSRDFKPRLWVSLDGNFWYGGQTSINDVKKDLTLQRNSRAGLTASLPISRHQSLKCSYSRGAYIRVGGDYQNVSVGWQYSWLGRPD